MKKKYVGFLFIGGICAAYACGQEFIKSPKVKKVYVSCQQYLELTGDLTVNMNSFWALCTDLLHIASGIQKGCLETINAHIDGDADCFLQQADKVQRTDKYTKLMKIKQEFAHCDDELRAMKQRLEGLIADFNA